MGSDGCKSVTLFQDIAHTNRVATISEWDSPTALDNYRQSQLFKETWSVVKPMFQSPAEAISYRSIQQ